MTSPLERSAAAAINSRGVSDPATAAVANTCREALSNRLNERCEELADDPAAVGRAHELLDEQRVAAGAGVQLGGVDRAVDPDRAIPRPRVGALRRHRAHRGRCTRDERRRSSKRGMSGSRSRLVATKAIGASSTDRGRCWSTQMAVGSAQCRSSRTTNAGAHADERVGQRFEVVPSTHLGRDCRVAERLDAERAVDSAPELHRLPPGPVGLAPQDPHARGPRDRRSFVHQSGLADAGLADHQRDAGPARSRGVERRPQERHLALPADERPRESGVATPSPVRITRSCQTATLPALGLGVVGPVADKRHVPE